MNAALRFCSSRAAQLYGMGMYGSFWATEKQSVLLISDFFDVHYSTAIFVNRHGGLLAKGFDNTRTIRHKTIRRCSDG